MSIQMIAAIDRNRLMGKGGKLPWHLPEDLAYFRAKTLHKTVIMGRSTYQSLHQRPLPYRRNIVLTRHPSQQLKDCETAISLKAALSLAAVPGQQPNAVFIIGGQRLYREALPQTDILYLTLIEHSFEGDCYFPPLDPKHWQCVSQIYHPSHAHRPFSFYTLTLKRACVSKQNAINSPPHPQPPSKE